MKLILKDGEYVEDWGINRHYMLYDSFYCLSHKKSFPREILRYQDEIKCPHCGTLFSRKDAYFVLPKGSYYPLAINYFVDGNIIRIALLKEFVTGFGGKVQRNANLSKVLSMNLATGMTYRLPALTMNKKGSVSSGSLHNICTIGAEDFKAIVPEKMVKEIYNIVYPAICRRVGKKVLKYNCEDINDVILCNRYPGLNPRKMKDFNRYLLNRPCKETFRAKRKIGRELKANSPNLEFIIPQLCGCRATKFYRNLLAETPEAILTYPYLSKFFKDINNLIKVLPNTGLVCMEFNCIGRFYFCREAMDSFIADLIKRHGETIAANKLSFICQDSRDTNERYYRDIISMYRGVKHGLGDTPMLRDKIEHLTRLNGNMEKIHDDLVLASIMVGNTNRVIPYSEEERRLQGSYNGFKFSLPEDTNTLKEIGYKMRICVGSYDTRALNKLCTIVSVVKKGKYVACIEVVKSILYDQNYQCIVQAKAYCNGRVEDEVLDSILEWSKDKKLRIKTRDISICEKEVR